MNIKILVAIVFCLISTNVKAASVSYFDAKPLYRDPFANVRSPDTGVTINTSKYLGEKVGYLEASLGKNIPIITAQFGEVFKRDFQMQFGLAAGFWGTLGYDDGAFPLLTEDFLLSVPLSFRWGNFSGAVKFNHISAHQGDGFDKLLEEKLSKQDQEDLETAENLLEDYTQNDEIGITLKEPLSYSRDFFSLHVAYDGKVGVFNNRIYAHAGYAHKMIPDTLNRWFVGSGFEAIYPSDKVAPYYAQDVTWNGDTDSVDLSSELGLIVLSSKTKHYTLRVAATTYIGTDRRGQLINHKMKQFGVGFFIY